MPEVKVVNMAGEEVGTMTLPEEVFAVPVNPAVLHSAVRAYLLNQRQGTQSTRTRTEVSGGGKKPWRQKGTGRARQGSTRAPQWTHGGVALGPKPRSYRVTLNRKTRTLALKGALSDKLASGDLIVVDEITSGEYKTKPMVAMLGKVGGGKKNLVVLPAVDEKTIVSLRNIAGTKTSQWNELNVYDILNADKLILARGAVEKIGEVYTK